MNEVFKVLLEPKKTPFDFSLKLIRIQFCVKISSRIFVCLLTIHNPLVLHGEKDLMIHVLILQLDLQEVFSRFMVSMTGLKKEYCMKRGIIGCKTSFLTTRLQYLSVLFNSAPACRLWQIKVPSTRIYISALTK